MSRLLFIVQEDTDREYALPTRPEGHLYELLREQLADLKILKGEVGMTPEAREWYLAWYKKHHREILTDDKMAGYHERKPDHLIRAAFITRLTIDRGFTLLPQDLESALGILDWLEARLPRAFADAASTPSGAMHQRILKILEDAGGTMPHSILLRKLQHLTNARAFRECIETLKESECIIEEGKINTNHMYRLLNKPKK